MSSVESTIRTPGIVNRGNRYQVRYTSPDGKSHPRSAPTLEAARELQGGRPSAEAGRLGPTSA